MIQMRQKNREGDNRDQNRQGHVADNEDPMDDNKEIPTETNNNPKKVSRSNSNNSKVPTSPSPTAKHAQREEVGFPSSDHDGKKASSENSERKNNKEGGDVVTGANRVPKSQTKTKDGESSGSDHSLRRQRSEMKLKDSGESKQREIPSDKALKRQTSGLTLKEARAAERHLIKQDKELLMELVKKEEKRALKKAAKEGWDAKTPFKLEIPSTSQPKMVKAKTQHKNKSWKKFKTLTLDSLGEDYIIRETQRSQYGGRKDVTSEATGFFYVKKLDGRWSLVDPEGNLFFSVGLNGTGPFKDDKKFQKAFASEYESTQEWAMETNEYLFNQLGFNTIGCWSDPSAFRDSGFLVPYCPHWNFMQTYAKRRVHGAVKLGDGPMPIFDSEFESFCDEHAKSLVESRNDPWLLGHFADNELPLKENEIIERYLALPDKDPGYLFAVQWLTERKRDKDDITSEDNTDFCTEIISRYYRIVSGAMKKHDPNHLFLGTRFHGYAAKQDCTFVACAPYVDVISVNYYHRWTPEQDWLNRCSNLSGRPIMVTEWYAKGEDAPGCDNSIGAGVTVPTQDDRGTFYEHFSIGLLRNPNVVGWHWFRYLDKGANMGILDTSFTPYFPLAEAMQRINTKIYSLSDYLLTESASMFSYQPDDVDDE